MWVRFPSVSTVTDPEEVEGLVCDTSINEFDSRPSPQIFTRSWKVKRCAHNTEVERHVQFIDGIPYSKPSWGKPLRLGSWYHDHFYVHPETGILLASRTKDCRSKSHGKAKPT
jgi:hypothetical protein